MHDSQARPPFSAVISCSGVEKSPGEEVPVVDDDVWLKVEDHLVHSLGLPTCGIERPCDVIPQDVYFAIVGQ
jgi:hypothetical protein